VPRPLTFREPTAGTVVRAVEAGLSLRAACRVAGVPGRTVRGWIQRGAEIDRRDGESMDPLAVFARRVDAAKAMAAVNTINASKDWKAAAWMLERLYPEDYGPGRGLEELARQVDALARRVGVCPSALGV
jgi:hypothetical protein